MIFRIRLNVGAGCKHVNDDTINCATFAIRQDGLERGHYEAGIQNSSYIAEDVDMGSRERTVFPHIGWK